MGSEMCIRDRDNPISSLNSLAPSTPLRIARDSLALAGRAADIAPQARSHLLRHVAANAVGELSYLCFTKRRFKQCLQHAVAQWRLRAAPRLLYGLDGVTRFAAGKAVVFDTTLLNHLGTQLTASTLRGLARDSGICLAHTYFGWSPERASNVFRRMPSGSLELLPSFVEAAEELHRLGKDRAVVSLSFCSLRRALGAFTQAKLIREHRCWQIQSILPVTIGMPEGFPEAGEASGRVHGRRLLHLEGLGEHSVAIGSESRQ